MSDAERPKQPATIRRGDVEWIEIGAAARFSRTKKVVIAAAIEAGTIAGLEDAAMTFIPMSVAHRLKRETGTLLAVKRKTCVGDSVAPPKRRPGPHAARERQDVLPMSSGRSGQGWLGQKPRT